MDYIGLYWTSFDFLAIVMDGQLCTGVKVKVIMVGFVVEQYMQTTNHRHVRYPGPRTDSFVNRTQAFLKSQEVSKRECVAAE